MSIRTARQDFIDRLLANWTDGGGLLRTPVNLENKERLITSTDGTQTIERAQVGQPWLRFGLRGLEDSQPYICPNNEIRVDGVAYWQMFVPEGDGTEDLDGYVDQIRALFQGARFGTMRCSRRRRPTAPARVAAAIAGTGTIPGQTWWRETVWIPFEFCEIRAAA